MYKNLFKTASSVMILSLLVACGGGGGSTSSSGGSPSVNADGTCTQATVDAENHLLHSTTAADFLSACQTASSLNLLSGTSCKESLNGVDGTYFLTQATIDKCKTVIAAANTVPSSPVPGTVDAVHDANGSCSSQALSLVQTLENDSQTYLSSTPSIAAMEPMVKDCKNLQSFMGADSCNAPSGKTLSYQLFASGCSTIVNGYNQLGGQ